MHDSSVALRYVGECNSALLITACRVSCAVEMSTTKAPFFQSILGRSLAMGVLPTALVLAVVLTSNGIRAFSSSTAALENDLRDRTRIAVDRIQRDNAQAALLTKTLAEVQEVGMFGRREETLALLRRVAKSNPNFRGAYIVYEPASDGTDAAALASTTLPPESMDATGRFVPYVRNDASAVGGLVLEETEDTEDDGGLWYEHPKELYERAREVGTVLTKPYSYHGEDIIECVYPIVINNRFAGIAAVDIPLARMQRELEAIAKELGGDIFLETRGFYLLATTDPAGTDAASLAKKLRTKEIKGTSYASFFDEIARSGEIALSQRMDPVLGEECYYVAATIAPGDWHFVLRKPRSEVFAETLATLLVNVVSAFVGLAIVFVLLWLVAARISSRVLRAQVAARSIAQGELSLEGAVVEGEDETAELLRGIESMRRELGAIVGSVRGNAQRLAASAAELSATSRQQARTAESFSGSTAQIAAAVREISGTGAELLRSVDEVDSGARRGAESATAGRAGIDAMAASMQRLDRSTAEVAERLEAIREKAQAITTVVTTIAKVADQTNLLSVNAAIEAEKAGESGRGFLVVAREVRHLADQTASATLDIGRMVQQMQDAVASGTREMGQLAIDMRSGLTEVAQIGQGLSHVIEEFSRTSERFGAVKEGMQSQAIGVSQIHEAMQVLVSGARETGQSVAECSRVADELSHAVATLQETVARFTLPKVGR